MKYERKQCFELQIFYPPPLKIPCFSGFRDLRGGDSTKTKAVTFFMKHRRKYFIRFMFAIFNPTIYHFVDISFFWL